MIVFDWKCQSLAINKVNLILLLLETTIQKYNQ